MASNILPSDRAQDNCRMIPFRRLKSHHFDASVPQNLTPRAARVHRQPMRDRADPARFSKNRASFSRAAVPFRPKRGAARGALPSGLAGGDSRLSWCPEAIGVRQVCRSKAARRIQASRQGGVKGNWGCGRMGCAKGLCPFAGNLRARPELVACPSSQQERGQGGGRSHRRRMQPAIVGTLGWYRS